MLSRRREDVQSRHEKIHWLKRQRWHMTLKEIAKAVGLADHSSVLYHLDGKCWCEREWIEGMFEPK